MFEKFQTLFTARKREEGASAVEYGLLVALIAAIIVAAVLTLGGTVKGAFDDTNTGIEEGQSESGGSTP